MNRFTVVALLVASMLVACRGAAPFPPNLFPQSAAGGWTRTSMRELGISESPDPVPRSAVDRYAVATYQGPGKLEARVYALSAPAVGVELAQRWRPSADTVFFYRDRYFAVVKWQSADRKALEAFVTEMEGKLGPPRTNMNG